MLEYSFTFYTLSEQHWFVNDSINSLTSEASSIIYYTIPHHLQCFLNYITIIMHSQFPQNMSTQIVTMHFFYKQNVEIIMKLYCKYQCTKSEHTHPTTTTIIIIKPCVLRNSYQEVEQYINMAKYCIGFVCNILSIRSIKYGFIFYKTIDALNLPSLISQLDFITASLLHKVELIYQIRRVNLR